MKKIIFATFCLIKISFVIAQPAITYDQSGNRISIKKGGNKPAISTISGINQNITFAGTSQESGAYTYTVANTSGSMYQWTVNGGRVINGQGQNEALVVWQKNTKNAGNVFVVETNRAGCKSDTAKYSVTFGIITATGGPYSEQTLNLFPNPTHRELTVSFTLDVTSEVSASIMNILGQEIRLYDWGKQSRGPHVNYINDLDLLPSGTYLLTLKTQQITTTQKVVVK
ncbi:hypothetical protein GCM10028805_19930 [Spirosoma harenae]